MDALANTLNVTAITVGRSGASFEFNANTLTTSSPTGVQYLGEAVRSPLVNDLNANGAFIYLTSGRFNTVSGGDIAGEVNVLPGATLGGTGQTSNIPSISGTISPGTSPGILNTQSVKFVGGAFAVEIGGATPGNAASNHDQLNVAGTVDLGNATLTLAQFNGFESTPGQQFVIVNNDGTDPIIGTFGGTSEGATTAAGKVGQAFSFDGVDDFVQVADAQTFNPMIAVTLDAWVFVSGGQGLHRDIISKDGEGFDSQYLLSASQIDRYRAHVGVPSGFINFDGSTTVQLNT